MNDLWQPVPFDRDLIKKYDRPGPRYTSYPTAPHFQDGFGPEGYTRLLRQSRDRGLPLSLYVHIPFCTTRCFFCGCNVAIARSKERGHHYLGPLEGEMALAARELGGAERQVIQIHWGGGTPTFLTPADLAEVMAMIRRHFRLADDCEIGVEVDPRESSEEHLDVLRDAGVNRLSLGVQDLDPKVQEAVNRLQPLELTRRVIEGARQRGIGSINVDLIYGLPYQTPESFRETVGELLELEPDRFAVFNFAYLPEMIPHQRAIDREALPDPETKLTLLENVVADLTAAGYVFIGMDHFAKPGDTLSQALRDRTLTRNFQGYSTRGECDLVGFGVSAIGLVADGYAQNTKEIPAYGKAIEEQRLATTRGLVMSPEDRLRRDVILRLMCHFRLEKTEVEELWGIDFDRHFGDALAELGPLAEDELVTLSPERIEVTPRGRLLVRNIAMAFDAYLKPGAQAAGAVRYSRTV